MSSHELVSETVRNAKKALYIRAFFIYSCRGANSTKNDPDTRHSVSGSLLCPLTEVLKQRRSSGSRTAVGASVFQFILSAELAAGGDGIVKHQKMQLLLPVHLTDSGEQHAV